MRTQIHNTSYSLKPMNGPNKLERLLLLIFKKIMHLLVIFSRRLTLDRVAAATATFFIPDVNVIKCFVFVTYGGVE